VKTGIASLVLLSACARASAEHGGREAKATACGSCHGEIEAEWRASFHRASFTDGTFQASLALEQPSDRSFCVKCHAPASDLAEGVACTSCHSTPHRTSAVKVTCSGCHEFAFDHGRAELVQKTASEHAASPFAGVECAECHAPPRGGHTDHRFVSGHAPAWIRERVRLRGSRAFPQGTNALALTIDVDAGHAFPTGDMFRRARLLVFAERPDGRIVGDAERVFGRTWASLRDGDHAGARTQEGDTRIRGTWSEVLSFDDPAISRVRWSLLFERILAVRGPHVDVVSSDEVASGELAW
jgi:hypothetical protein